MKFSGKLYAGPIYAPKTQLRFMKFCQEIVKSYCPWTMNPDFFYFAWVEWYSEKSEEISDKKI
jgi:NADPH-dependent 7-cyano-7-deazaguanine reductase QueF